MIKLLAAAAVLLPTVATGQATTYATNNPAPMKGDPNKVVCKKDETIGTRLGARRVCLTVEQWKEKHREHREFAEDMQSGAWGARSDPAVEAKTPGAGAPQ